MGTNFYVYSNVCPHCGRGDEPKHIGKSSAGWCFSLHVIPEEGINSLSDWKEYWKEKVVKDEYGDIITEEEMLLRITERKWEKNRTDKKFLDENHAEPGPNNLLRHKIDKWHCVGHGEGTWDYITGEFS